MIRQLLDNIDFSTDLELWLLAVFVLALLVALRSLPLVIYIDIQKHLFDEPGERSTHTHKVPILGGVSIYISLILAIGLSGVFMDSRILILLAACLTLLFFLGLKDDLFVLAPKKKFYGQLAATLVLVLATDIRIIGFSDMFSVQTLPYWVSIAFTVFVFILIINAINLIDGINGLAGSIGLMASLVFGYLFYMSGDLIPATMAVALAGSLIPFLRLNMVKPRIFMGDTGSMIVGFMLAYFTVSFINAAQTNPDSDFYSSVPVLVEAILFFPLLDTLRIFIIRIFVHKTSPFKADRNHIHHRLLNLGYSHLKATLIIIAMNLGIIGLAFAIKDMEIHIQLLCITGFGVFLFVSPFFQKIKNNNKSINKLRTSSDK